jgi:hypothetical protein
LENQWEIQRRRRLWAILIGWDVHTGIVLGRPISIDRSMEPTLPVDAPIPKDRSKTPVQPRSEDDPPTPLTRALWSYKVMCVLRDVLDLEQDGPCPKSFARVDKVHEDLQRLEAETPAYFRLENPDKRFDNLPECWWLPSVRATLPQLQAFDYMALHRPYIFTRPKSRSEALKACLRMLQAQRLQFQNLKPSQYKTWVHSACPCCNDLSLTPNSFTLFFGTFDAIVLMSSIYILFPKEHPELLQSAMQHFQWSVERFEVMSERNRLAKQALSVLQAIHTRLKKCLGMACVPKSPLPMIETPDSSNLDPSLTDGSLGPPTTAPSSAGFTPNNQAGEATAYGSLPTPTGTEMTATSPAQPLEFALPPDFDWASIQPIFPMSDLAYNDLAGIEPALQTQGAWQQQQQPEMLAQQPGGGFAWQFDGDFQDNSLWSLLNQYAP